MLKLKSLIHTGLIIRVFIIIIIILVCKCSLSIDFNSYPRRRNATEEAKDIAQAILEYKKHNGVVPNMNQAGWIFGISSYLNDADRARITSVGQIRDCQGNLYEFTQRGDTIDIFSYEVFQPIRVNISKDQIEDSHPTNFQCLKSLFHVL